MKKLLTGFAVCAFALASAAQGTTQVPLKAIYGQPATVWESEALPIGNGYMGAMIFGNVFNEVIQVNEKTLWSGGPGEDADYNGGLNHTSAEVHQALQEFRIELQTRMNKFDNSRYEQTKNVNDARDYDNHGFYDEKWEDSLCVNRILGSNDHFGSFQTMSNITLDDADFPVIDSKSIRTNADNSNNQGETIESLFDGNTSSKWFGGDFVSGKFPITITWNYNNAPELTGYSLTSGNDVPGRDPRSWVLYGSTDGNDYVVIDRRSGKFWTEDERRVTKDFTFDKVVKGYRFFKFEIKSLVGSGQKPQLSELTMILDEASFNYSDYTRALDLDHAIQTVDYKYNGNSYHREYFMSYPDNVMVVKLTAEKPFSRKIQINTPHSDYEMSAADNKIILTGWPTPVSGNRQRENDNWRNCLKFAQVLEVHSTDGEAKEEGNAIVVDNATEIVLVMSAATNYQQCMDDTFDYFSDENPLDKATARVNAAKAKGYDELLQTHQDDYCKLFNRNRISLASSVTQPTEFTDKMLAAMTAGTSSENVNRYLETLYYQYGRYLLISSSREGSLPANLQGVWGNLLSNPWSADYHANINIQMNYWLAEQTNLAECHLPMVEFVRSLEPRGTITAKHFYCRPDGGEVRGWAANHGINVWGNTSPGHRGTHSIFPEGGIWMCQDIWEYYQFNQDIEFLKKYYPTMKNAALFWVDNLWTDERDGKLVVNPSMSPEHGAFSLGCTSSQGILYEIFDAVEKAANILGYQNDPEVKEIVAAKTNMSMPKIGLGGQFMEWKDEVKKDLTGDGQWDPAQGRYVNTHRHTNHLFWLHPGSQVVPGRSDLETAYSNAMKKTLTTRGDEGTGWSRAWKLNFWARLRDGDHAHTMLRSCMNLTKPSGAGGVYTNLFDAHPPFQIDGNFGFTSGLAEMLIQSQGDKIELLPALPKVWKEGSFQGMRARGGFEVDATWRYGGVRTVTITSLSGNECVVKFPGAAASEVSGAVKRVISDDEIAFDTNKGDVIVITRVGAVNEVETSKKSSDDQCYDLQGRQVEKPSHGVYIKGHKKVYVSE